MGFFRGQFRRYDVVTVFIVYVGIAADGREFHLSILRGELLAGDSGFEFAVTQYGVLIGSVRHPDILDPAEAHSILYDSIVGFLHFVLRGGHEGVPARIFPSDRIFRLLGSGNQLVHHGFPFLVRIHFFRVDVIGLFGSLDIVEIIRGVILIIHYRIINVLIFARFILDKKKFLLFSVLPVEGKI